MASMPSMPRLLSDPTAIFIKVLRSTEKSINTLKVHKRRLISHCRLFFSNLPLWPAALLYLLIFRLDELGLEAMKKLILAQPQAKMIFFLEFVYDHENLLCVVVGPFFFCLRILG